MPKEVREGRFKRSSCPTSFAKRPTDADRWGQAEGLKSRCSWSRTLAMTRDRLIIMLTSKLAASAPTPFAECMSMALDDISEISD